MNDPRAEAVVRADTRRRVLAAFVTQSRSGETPPGSRTRHLTVGVVAAILVLTGGAVTGRLTPSSPGGWSDGDVLVGRSSAARLVSVDGVLHPLLNTASGRLLVPASTAERVVVVDDAVIAAARHGVPFGIPGAPDVLPDPTALWQTGWLACLDGARVRTRIGAISATTSPPDGRAEVVSVDGHPDEIDLVAADHRYRIPVTSYPAVKQYLDQPRSPRPAAKAWVALFPAGTELSFGSFRFAAPAGVGQLTADAIQLRGTATRIGQLVANTDRADAASVILADGTVPLTAFAAAVYRATAPPDLATPLAVTDADLARLPPSSTVNFTPPDWPLTPPPARSGSSLCAELDAASGRSPTTHLRFDPAPSTVSATPSVPPGPASSPVPEDVPTPPVVEPGGGAVVMVVTGPSDDGTTYLVDPSGRAFAMGAPSADTVARLGYAGVKPPAVPAAWLALCPIGPELSASAAHLSAGTPGSS